MSSITIKHNLNNVVYLRAIAAFMVLFCNYISSRNSFSETAVSFASLGQLGVHIFFVVSGFVIPIQLQRRNYTYRNLVEFFLNRIVRIYPCFLVVLFGAAVVWQIQYLVAGGVAPDLSFSNILKNIFLVFDVFDGTTYLGVAWTLVIEFSYYIVLAILFPLLFLKGTNYYLVICFCLLGVSFIGNDDSQRVNFFKWAPFFVCGFSIYRAKFQNKSKTAVITFLLGLGCILFRGGVHPGWIQAMVPLFVAFFICVLPAFKSSLLMFLGTISYSIYLVHGPVGHRVFGVMNYLGVNNDIIPWISFLLSTGISVGLSSLIYIWIEKPSHRWSKKIW